MKSALIKLGRRVLLDGWESLTQASMGASANANPANWCWVSPPTLSAQTLDSMYGGSWISRAIVDKKVRIAYKSGFQASDAAIAAYQRLGYPDGHPEGVAIRAESWARLHGGAVILAAHASGAGNMATPLSSSPGEVQWLDVIPRSWLAVETREEDPGAANPKRPLVFKVTDGPRSGLLFHVSRCIPFTGDTPSPSKWQEHDYFWGQSVLQSTYEEVLRMGQRNASVDRLLTRASMGALQIMGLLDAIADEEGGVLDARLEVLRQGVERANLLLLDEGESYQDHSVSLTGLDVPTTSSMQMVAGAAGYPLTVLFSMSPAGLNATGESDLNNFYDQLEAHQTQFSVPRLNTLLSWLSGSPEQVKFPNLRTLTEAEQATALAARVGAYSTIDSWNVVDPADLVRDLQHRGLVDPSWIVTEAFDNGSQAPPITE